MKKIITLFQRNYEGDRLVRDEIVPGAEWVAAGEGIATRKWDGSCCMVRDGRLYKRLELKRGKTPPADFEPMQDADAVTGAVPGWVPVGDGPEDQWFRAAMDHSTKFWCEIGVETSLPDGTYEAIGPHFGGGNHITNPEQRTSDMLERHGNVEWPDAPRDFASLKVFFRENASLVEGIVWHHPDGRMVKIKARDFGVK